MDQLQLNAVCRFDNVHAGFAKAFQCLARQSGKIYSRGDDGTRTIFQNIKFLQIFFSQTGFGHIVDKILHTIPDTMGNRLAGNIYPFI